MQHPIYSAAEEQELMARLWSPLLADDPLSFVLFVYPWGQPGTPLAKFKGPRQWQVAVLAEMREHIRKGKQDEAWEVFQKAITSGRGPGKSSLVAWLIHWFATTRIGSTGVISANTETQLRTITWAEIDKWVKMSLNAHWWEIVGIKMDPAKWLKQLVERDLHIGTEQWGAEGRLWSEDNPDAYAGIHNYNGVLVIFDEASGIADMIWSVAKGFFTELTPNRFWLALGNPRRGTGYFFECFNSKRDFWSCTQIDARTVEGTDKKLYDAIIAEYGADSYEAKVEVYGEFPSGDDETFIASSLVAEAIKRPKWSDTTAPIVLGIDPARGGDWTTYFVRQGRDVLDIRRYKTPDTMDAVGYAIELIEEYHPQLSVIDETGLGGPILDRAREQGYKIRGVNFGSKNVRSRKRWGNKRAEMWGDMKDWLKTASIPDDRRLRTDLCGPRTKPDSSGTMFLEGKKEMRARGVDSPDAADACAVTFAFPVANPEYTEKRASIVNRQTHRQTQSPQGWLAH